jgi:ABC-2 type transport system permease protein
LALGISGLLQTIIWFCAVFYVFNRGSLALRLPENFIFPVEILVWSLAFFIAGYLLYASLMAGAGALVPRLKESGITSAIIVFPLLVGYMIGIYAPLGRATEATLPVIASILPFTAPVVMVMRLTDGNVPTWQILVSLGLTFLTAYLTLRAVAAMFHAQNLLSGQPFSLNRYVKMLTGKV